MGRVNVNPTTYFFTAGLVSNSGAAMGGHVPSRRAPFPDHFLNPESRDGDALIPGFRHYEKQTKCPNFT